MKIWIVFEDCADKYDNANWVARKAFTSQERARAYEATLAASSATKVEDIEMEDDSSEGA